MPDPAEQLARIHQAGFELQTFERFPRAVGVVRGECMAMLQATADGMEYLGQPGWRFGQNLGVLVEQGARKVFQHKTQVVEATTERLELLADFKSELDGLLRG